MQINSSKFAYGVGEAAAKIGTTRGFLYLENKRGKLPFRKAGKRTLILHDDLCAYIETLPVLERSSATDEKAA